jgi:hypothetical protein
MTVASSAPQALSQALLVAINRHLQSAYSANPINTEASTTNVTPEMFTASTTKMESVPPAVKPSS